MISFDLTKLGLTTGNYQITVVANSDVYDASEASTPVEYRIPLTAPTIALVDDELTITASDLAEKFEILVNGEPKAIIDRSGNIVTE